jgi:hypothetical protein
LVFTRSAAPNPSMISRTTRHGIPHDTATILRPGCRIPARSPSARHSRSQRRYRARRYEGPARRIPAGKENPAERRRAAAPPTGAAFGAARPQARAGWAERHLVSGAVRRVLGELSRTQLVG